MVRRSKFPFDRNHSSRQKQFENPISIIRNRVFSFSRLREVLRSEVFRRIEGSSPFAVGGWARLWLWLFFAPAARCPIGYLSSRRTRRNKSYIRSSEITLTRKYQTEETSRPDILEFYPENRLEKFINKDLFFRLKFLKLRRRAEITSDYKDIVQNINLYSKDRLRFLNSVWNCWNRILLAHLCHYKYSE